jgi:hypothetical protein
MIRRNCPNGKSPRRRRSLGGLFRAADEGRRTGFFEIIGHADLPKKFGHRPSRDCTPLYRKFLDAAKKHHCAIELNTAGLRKDCREIYPSREILQLAFQTGVPITFGSDAHAPEEVGMNFAEAVQLARDVGYQGMLPVCAAETEIRLVLTLDFEAQFETLPAVKQSIVTLDMEGVLTPEIWIAVAEKTKSRNCAAPPATSRITTSSCAAASPCWTGMA